MIDDHSLLCPWLMMLPTSLMMSLSNLMKLSAPTCGDDDDDDDNDLTMTMMMTISNLNIAFVENDDINDDDDNHMTMMTII